MAIRHDKLSTLAVDPKVKDSMIVRNTVNYQEMAAALSELSEIEVLATHKAMKSLMKHHAVPQAYQDFAETINMVILDRVKNP